MKRAVYRRQAEQLAIQHWNDTHRPYAASRIASRAYWDIGSAHALPYSRNGFKKMAGMSSDDRCRFCHDAVESTNECQ